MAARNVRGLLYFQLPGAASLAPGFTVGITAWDLRYFQGEQCAGLQVQNATSGYLVDFCGELGKWHIYAISAAGAITRTLDEGLTASKRQAQLALTITGATLSYAIDGQTHDAGIATDFVPTAMAVNYISNDPFWTTNLTNFGYTPRS